ncbi:MAG: bifunctional glutamate N-acetyltransferase/amino-acid acetyltransferase ArgJ [Christensenellaceae bacterium]|jgi:glutamate N-acetyltransferase/amino-acid N-acetyltransferase
MAFTWITGGVTAPQAFEAAGLHCGIRKNRTKKDLALVFSKTPSAATAVYTQNLVQGAPCVVTKNHLANGVAQAIVCNSGIANTCAADGIEKAEQMCALTADVLSIAKEDVIVASTGVIGPSILIEPIAAAMPQLAELLSEDGHIDAAEAIMTTDTFLKECAVSFEIDGVSCSLGGMAKGSGMIAPNMATMLGFLTTDAAIDTALLQKALSFVVADTFNMLSIDGDTSTNDMLCILANGAAQNKPIAAEDASYEIFVAALYAVCEKLVRMLAKDGEGATKLLECNVRGAKTKKDAQLAAKSVISSDLFKAAMFGADANWGRVLCALGYAGAEIDVSGIAVSFSSEAGSIVVCEKGAGIPFSEEMAKKVLSEKEITIDITLSDGAASTTAWGCDLTYDYVKINGDYRS